MTGDVYNGLRFCKHRLRGTSVRRMGELMYTARGRYGECKGEVHAKKLCAIWSRTVKGRADRVSARVHLGLGRSHCMWNRGETDFIVRGQGRDESQGASVVNMARWQVKQSREVDSTCT